MTASCPVCASYSHDTRRQIDQAGDRYRARVADLRAKEAEGVSPMAELRDVRPFYTRLADATTELWESTRG